MGPPPPKRPRLEDPLDSSLTEPLKKLLKKTGIKDHQVEGNDHDGGIIAEMLTWPYTKGGRRKGLKDSSWAGKCFTSTRGNKSR